MSAFVSHRAAGSRFGPSAVGADLLSVLFLGAVWGAAFLFFRVAAPEVGPIWAAEIRVALAGVILAAIAGRSTLAAARGRWIAFAIVGTTFSAVPFALISIASLTLPASMGALLNAATPLFTALLAAAWLHQPLGRNVIAGLAVGLVAVIVLVGWSPLDPTPTTLVAIAAALGAAFSYAVAGSYVRRTMSGVGPLQLATGQLVAASIVLLPVALLSGPPGAPSAAATASLLALATVSTAVAWPLFQRVLKRRGSTAASTVTFIVPGFGIVWAAIVLGERIGPELVVGFGLLLVSLALVFGIRPPTVTRARLTAAHLAGVARAVAVRL